MPLKLTTDMNVFNIGLLYIACQDKNIPEASKLLVYTYNKYDDSKLMWTSIISHENPYVVEG